MVQVNLLPWREEARKLKKKRFLIRVAGCVMITLFLIVLYHIYIATVISSQQQGIDFLQTQLDSEQGALGSLDKMKKQQDIVDTKLKFILSLRNNSYEAVRLMDELARVVPEAVSLNKLVREGHFITIFGRAQSNLQVTLFMKNMEKSLVFEQPVLTEISVKENESGDERFFQLHVIQRETYGDI